MAGIGDDGGVIRLIGFLWSQLYLPPNNTSAEVHLINGTLFMQLVIDVGLNTRIYFYGISTCNTSAIYLPFVHP